MKKFCFFLIAAVVFNQALSRSLRGKRQTTDENKVEDRYGLQLDLQPINQGPFRPWYRTELTPYPNSYPGLHDFGQGWGQRGQNQDQRPVGTIASPSATYIRECVRYCPVTSEYNPVCGSNNKTYNNHGHLICAQNCGENVTLTRQSRCPTTPAPAIAEN